MSPPRGGGGESRPLRPLTEGDLVACADVFYAASDELAGRTGQPPMVRDPETMARLFRHLAFTAGGIGLAAEAPDRPLVAFGIAVEREACWFLSFLYVAPEAQGSGLGRALLERLLPPAGSTAAAPDALRHTCVDSLQPISTGLYSGYGLVPREALLTLVGRPAPGVLPELPPGIRALTYAAVPLDTRHLALPAIAPTDLPQDLLAELDAVDRRILGWRRRGDHGRFLADGRLLVRYRAPDDSPLGYGYVHRSGRLGPVAAHDPGLLPGMVADLIARQQPAGAWRIYVPGSAGGALVPLLRAGLRFEGSPGLWCATRPGIAWAGYLPATFALP
ncbi:MAG: GNAT family N-acetyltransferase [Candidatus Limnocylindrales bacterium]